MPRSRIFSAALVSFAAVLAFLVPTAAPASASLPDANVSWQSPTTFRLGSRGVIYPKLKVYLSSSFGDPSRDDLFYGTVVVRKVGGAEIYRQSFQRLIANRTLTFQVTIKSAGRYYFQMKGQMREQTTQCGTSPDCTVKVANVPARKIYFRVT